MSGGRLEVRDLRRGYGGRLVVDGVSIDVSPGEVVGLLGPNGAGKSTCFRIIAGLVDAEAGTVRLDGTRLDGLPLWQRVRRGLGYLAQEPSVFRRLTVRDNLRVPLESDRCTPRAEIEGRVDELIEQAGLQAVVGDRAGTLSGGERRRLEIARCLASRPRVVLLDEPFSGVDPVAVADLQARIAALAASGLGVLLTDHAVREALGTCDRAIILDGGTVMVEGSPRQVAAHPVARARYLGPAFDLPEPRA